MVMREELPEEERDRDQEAQLEEGELGADQEQTEIIAAEVETEGTETDQCLPGAETLIDTDPCHQTNAKKDQCLQTGVKEDVIVREDRHQEHQMQAAETQDLEETSQEADLWIEQDINNFCIVKFE